MQNMSFSYIYSMSFHLHSCLHNTWLLYSMPRGPGIFSHCKSVYMHKIYVQRREQAVIAAWNMREQPHISLHFVFLFFVLSKRIRMLPSFSLPLSRRRREYKRCIHFLTLMFSVMLNQKCIQCGSFK